MHTDARARSLEQRLLALRHLEYTNFEVCAVRRPAEDGIRQVVDRWTDRVKVEHCAHRNLSIYRNVGIAMASGEIVAFIDDDVIPEQDCLGGLVAACDQPDVGAASGVVYDNPVWCFRAICHN
jgi:glycogen synthase